MRSYPLIRKKHSILDIFKHIIKMIKSRGKEIKKQMLIIPKTGSYEDVTFKSYFTEDITDCDENEIPTTPEKLIKLVEDFAIKGKGGASFPMHIKLRAFNKSDTKSRVLIINAAECDPGLFHDQWIALNLFKEVNKSADVLKKVFNIDKVFIASKFDIPAENWPGISVVKVPDSYPIGAEKALVKIVLGIEPQTYNYPVDLGVLVHNIQTLFTLNNTMYNPNNISMHFLTYFDIKSNKSIVALTNKGTIIEDVCDKNNIYTGGGIMQSKAANKSDIIDESINFIASGISADFKEGSCKGCKQCTSHCPLGLDVHTVVNDDMDIKDSHKCVKCGSCSYLCPAGIDLCSKIKELSA